MLPEVPALIMPYMVGELRHFCLILVGHFLKPSLVCYVDVWGRNLVGLSDTSSLGIIRKAISLQLVTVISLSNSLAQMFDLHAVIRRLIVFQSLINKKIVLYILCST